MLVCFSHKRLRYALTCFCVMGDHLLPDFDILNAVRQRSKKYFSSLSHKI